MSFNTLALPSLLDHLPLQDRRDDLGQARFTVMVGHGDLLGGQVEVFFDPIIASGPFVKQGKPKALAIGA